MENALEEREMAVEEKKKVMEEKERTFEMVVGMWEKRFDES